MGFTFRDIHARHVNQQDNSNTYVAGPGAVLHVDASQQLDRLRQLVERLPMHPSVVAAARQELHRIGAELAAPQPDRAAVGDSVERFAKLAQSAGALAGAGQAMLGPLSALAHWLGDRGQPILELLAGPLPR